MRSSVVLACSFALAGLATLLCLRAGLPRETAYMAGIFTLAALLWVSEALPLFATSLLVIGLEVLLLANPGGWPGLGFTSAPSPGYRAYLTAAADPVLLLFFGGFILAQAAVRTGVDRSISGLLLRPFGSKPRWVLLGVMSVTLLFGMWMSNTAVTTLMLAFIGPLLLAVPPGDPFRKALMLGVPLAANLSGLATPVASPPNAVALGYLAKSGLSVGFLDWMCIAVPLTLLLLVLAWALLWHRFRPATAGLSLNGPAEPLGRRGWLVVATFAATVLLWISEGWHGLPAPVVALFPVVFLAASRVITRDDLRQIEWNVLILIAGGLALGAGLQATGLDQAIARGLLPEGRTGFSLLMTLIICAWIVGMFMSNTAAANLFLPIGLSAASTQPGVSPVQVALSLALVSSLSMMLPISTPPNAIAHARGEFTTADLMRVGLPLGLAGLLLLLLALPLLLARFL